MADDVLRAFLDAVESNLRGAGKADILREIESHVLDRAEALAEARGGAPEPDDIRKAIAELGDPSELAVSYSGERYLIGPKEYAAFWYFTGLLFAIHFATLLIAAMTATRFGFFPFNVLPPARLTGALTLVSLAVQAFLFDAGLVLVLFFLLGRTFRRVELPNLTFRVESSRGPSIRRAVFTGLVAILIGVPGLRESLFVVHITDAEGRPVAYTLFRPEMQGVLPGLIAFLLLAVVKDVLYAWKGERRWTVALDGFTAVGGVLLCLFLLSRPSVVGLPQDFPLSEELLHFFNEAVERVLDLFFILWAALFAARAVRRIARLRQIWEAGDAPSVL